MTLLSTHPATPPTRTPLAESLWFIRINPLARRRLADPVQRRLLGELREAEAETDTQASQASAELFARIGSATDDEARREMVAARRGVHRDRTPRAGQATTPAVERWAAARARRDELRAAVTAGYPAAADRERSTLAALLGQEDLQRALALVAPEVHESAERYRAAVAGAAPLSARTRKSERGLLQYVTRAMMRTSPLSRFTAVCLAVPDPAGADPTHVRPTGAVAFPGLDRVMLGFVLDGLDAPAPDDPAAVRTSWVAVAPTSAVDVDGDRFCFLRSTDTGLSRVAVPLSPPVRLLLDAVAMGPRRVDAVAGHLAAFSGCPPEKALGIVCGAVRSGLLSAAAAPEDGSAELTDLLSRPGSAAADLLSTVRHDLARLEVGSAADRGADLERIEAGLTATSRRAGRPARINVDEDYVLPPTTVNTRGWHGALEDLSAATELLSVFDWLHDVRVLMSAAFVERFGPGANVSLAEHAGFIVDEVSRRALAVEAVHKSGGGSLAGIGPADGCLDRLQSLRREVTAAVHARLDETSHAGDSELALTPPDARRLAEGMPERFRSEPLLYGVLVQPCADRLIFNDGLPGHGMLYSRFLAADRALGGDAVGRLRDRIVDRYGRDGHRVVEDVGLHGLNVNAHTPVLPDVLRAGDWFSLRLEHDPETDALRVTDADGRPLRVLPLGAGHPGLFPPPLSVATGLVISGRLFSGLMSTWQEASGWDGLTTRTCPRLSVGDVVVSRRRWYGGQEMDTAVAAGPQEHDRLLALASWRGRHDVPPEVVLKTTPTDDGPMSVGAPDLQANRLQQKPQYVDLDSALGVRVLPRMLERRPGAGYVEEALPAVGDGPHAAEWVVEIGRRPYGQFRYEGEQA